MIAPDPDRESALIARAQAGDVGARNALIARHLPLLVKVAGRTVYRLGMPMEHEDAVQEAAISAVQAIKAFNPRLGFKLNTYLGVRAAFHLRNLAFRGGLDGMRPAKKVPNERRPASLAVGDWRSLDRPMRGNPFADFEMAESVRELLGEHLSASDLAILDGLFWRGLTQKEMRAELGISKGWMSQQRKELLEALREPLAGLLER